MGRLLIILFLFFYSLTDVLSQDISINGIYHGQDLYVQNPYSSVAKEFCTEEVYVNDQKVLTKPRASAYRIKLSHLDIGAKIEIRILHLNGCTPRILNPQVVNEGNEFEFKSIQSTRNAISWLTEGELPGGDFTIKRLNEKEEWGEVKNVPGKGGIISGNYEVPLQHIGGLNIYKVIYKSSSGNIVESPRISYNYKEAPITFTPYNPTTRIVLSRQVDYLITDKDGNKYLEGNSDFINVKDLPSGDYVLHIQGREETFYIDRPLKPIKKKKDKKN